MHARTIITEDWLRHKGRQFAMLIRSVFAAYFTLRTLSALESSVKLHADFVLARGCHFMVMNFNR